MVAQFLKHINIDLINLPPDMLFAAITASAMGGVIEDSTEKYKANI